MRRRVSSALLLMIIVFEMLNVTVTIQTAGGAGTIIYIRADGSVDPLSAPIQKVGDEYHFAEDIYGSLVVERNDTVIDGNHHTLHIQGIGLLRPGLNLGSRRLENITVINIDIDGAHSGWYGILCQNCSGVSLLGITIRNCWTGIRFVDSTGSILRDNALIENTQDFSISATEISNYDHDIDSSNTIDGKQIVYWVDRHDLSVPQDAAFIGLVNCTRIVVNGLTSMCEDCVLVNTNDTQITGCTPISNNPSLLLVRSSGNSISGNRFLSTISLLSSSNNSMSENHIDNVQLTSSSNNSISNNMMEGISLLDSDWNSISANNLSGSSYETGIEIARSSHNMFDLNVISGYDVGTYIRKHTENNTLRNNRISNNKLGLRLDGSHNLIFQNQIRENEIGIVICFSNNTISGNNLANRFANIWNVNETTTVRIVPSQNEFGNSSGDPVLIPGTRFTVDVNVSSVLNLFGVDIEIKWDTRYLHLVSHEKMIPVETHPGGVLHKPTIPIKDNVDETANMSGSTPGTMCWISEVSLLPAPSFWTFESRILTMTFEVKKQPIMNETGNPNAINPVDTLIEFTYTNLLGKDGSLIPHVAESANIRIWERRPHNPCDVNDDGIVNIQDIAIVAGIYGSTNEKPDWNPMADVAAPYRKIDILDLVTIATHYGEK